jgi:hypothetical protein
VNNRTSTLLLAAALAAVVAAAAGWYHASAGLRELHMLGVVAELQPAAVLLKENQALITELQAEPFAEKDTGVLASYLSKIRRDGVAKHADMKQRLDELAENNTAIVTLIKAYSPQAKTPAFTTATDKFRSYASAWRDRWNSVMELFMAGGNYAASGVPFPAGLPAAADAEIAAAK